MDRGEQIHPRIGTLIEGRYRILRCIGEGGMGSIHEVIDLRTDVRRALKLVRPALRAEASFAERLLAEARIVARIKSDHIVPVTDAGIDGDTGAAFFVMDLLEGESLAALSKRRGRTSPAELVAMLHQVALALDRAHAAGVAHLDLKPANLFATSRDDGSPSIKVLDFGIARAASAWGRGPDALHAAAAGGRGSDAAAAAGGRIPDAAHEDARGVIAGTTVYMAPEQLTGRAEIGPAADLHALGMVAFALLVGEPYFEEERRAFGDDRIALRDRIALGVGELPSARALRRCDVRLPPAFDVWLTRATAPRPDDRFATATDAVTALARALGEPVPRPSIVLQGASRSGPETRGEGGETTETALTTDRPSARPRPFPFRRAALALFAVAIAATGALRLAVAPSAVNGPGSTDSAAPPPPEASAAAEGAPESGERASILNTSASVRGAPESEVRAPVLNTEVRAGTAESRNVPVLASGAQVLDSSAPVHASGVPVSASGPPVSASGPPVLASGPPVLALSAPVLASSVPVRAAGKSGERAPVLTSSAPLLGAAQSATPSPRVTAATAPQRTPSPSAAPQRTASPSGPVPYEGIY